MIDGVDSKRNVVGDVFKASLETDLAVNNVLVARRGSDAYVRLAYTKEARGLSGSSELQLELTRIIIDGREFPVVSGEYTMKGKGPRRRHCQESGRWSGHWRNYWRRCGRRHGRGNRRRSGRRCGRGSRDTDARTGGASAQRNVAGVPAGTTGYGYSDAALSSIAEAEDLMLKRGRLCALFFISALFIAYVPFQAF